MPPPTRGYHVNMKCGAKGFFLALVLMTKKQHVLRGNLEAPKPLILPTCYSATSIV